MKRTVVAAVGVLAMCFTANALASYNVLICGGWSTTAMPLVPAAAPGTQAVAYDCGGPGSATLVLAASGQQVVAGGEGASWSTTAPPDVTISHIYSYNDSVSSVGNGNGWWGEFFWNGGPGPAGRSSQLTPDFSTSGCCQASFNNRTVGWFISCGWSSCNRPAVLDVGGVALTVNEDRGPTLTALGPLWYTPGWIRDKWTVAFVGDSPSGVCGLYASLNGQSLTLGPSSTVPRNTGTWHQCSGATANETIQTADYGAGPMPLTIGACDAAGACTGTAYTKTLEVDNSHPTISLSSPGDVPSTAGPQDVTATAGGSPSGIAEIDCSVDGGPTQRYVEGGAPQPSAQIPVSGVGVHTITCTAANTAVAQDWSHAWSNSPAATTLKIGQPTVAAISFLKVADALRCSRARKRVTVPAQWVRVRRRGKIVLVRRRAHTKVVAVTRCHARTVRRRITVWAKVRRHGKIVRVRRTKVVRVVLVPHVVAQTSQKVSHGEGTTVSGWLGTSAGVALGGAPVRVLTAPDNDLGQFSQVAVATTTPNGGWTAQLPPGPSRLVEAVYDGAATTEPSTSNQVRVIVPAEVKLLSVRPRRVPWGATVRLEGQLLGGYLPPGGALVRLRLGYKSTYNTYGVQEHVAGDGRFSTTASFGPGDPRIHRTYWFQIASLPMGNYPYAPAASRRVTVAVGGHPR